MLIRRRKLARKYVQTKLIFKLRMLFVIMLIMSSVLVYDLFKSVISFPLLFLGITLGLAIGFTMGKFTNIIWNEESSKVISRMDRIGVIALIIYLPFAFFKKWIFGHWIHGPVLTAFSFSIAASIMFGRIISIRRQIRNLLKERGLLVSLRKRRFSRLLRKKSYS